MSFLLIGVTVLYFLPLALESYISRSLDLQGIRKLMVQTLERRTGLHIRIQGVRFDLFHGIVFTGVDVYPETPSPSHSHIFRTENLVLQISYLNLFRDRPPFRGLLVYEGRLDPWAMNLMQWRTLALRLSGEKQPDAKGTPAAGATNTAPQPEKPPENSSFTVWNRRIDFSRETLLKDLTFSVKDLEIQLPEELPLNSTGPVTRPQVFVDGSIAPYKNGLEVRMNLTASAGKDERGSVRAKGRWDLEEDRRILFDFKTLPARLVFPLLQNLALLPHDLPSPGLNVRQGRLNGTGSIHFYAAGMGIDVKGDYNKLGLELTGEESPLFQLRRADGKLEYNAGFYRESNEPAYIKYSMKQDDFNIELFYKNIKDNREKDNRLEVHGGFRLTGESGGNTEPSLSVPGWNASGAATYSVFMPSGNDNGQIHPRIDLTLNDFRIPIPEPDSSPGREANEAPASDTDHPHFLALNQGHLSVSDQGNTKLELVGSFYEAPFSLMGSGTILFLRDPSETDKSPEQRDFIIQRDLNLNLDMDRFSYPNLVSFISLAHQRLYYSGTGRKAKKVEDMGPVWKNKFTDTDFYKKVVRPWDMDLNIHLNEMQNAGNALPQKIDFHFLKKGAHVDASIPSISQGGTTLSFVYKSDLDLSLPRHDMKLDLSIHGNTLPFPEFLGNKSPPSDVDIHYVYGGEGFLAGDIMNRSYSSLVLEMHGVDLIDLSPARIALHSLHLDPAAFRADTFQLYRSSDGPATTYNRIYIHSPLLEASGQGQHNPMEGGKVFLNYTYAAPGSGTQSRGSIQYRIMEDESWVPYDGY